MMNRSRFVLLAVLVCTMNAGAQEEPERSGTQLTLDDLRTFTDVFNQVRTRYVEEVDEHTLLTDAIEGMLSSLDPYSVFLDPEQFRALDEASRGRHGGIGVRTEVRDGRIFFDDVLPGSPAELGGARAGDMLISVDGQAVRGRKLSESIAALDGEPGSALSIRLKSVDQAVRELRLIRDFVEVASVKSKLLEGAFAYFEISHFHRNSHSELENAIHALQAARNAPLAGIILDLRRNAGGVLQGAIEMADGFLDQGLIVTTRGRDAVESLEFQARPGQWTPGIPVAVLVDRRTASASEVLAGALQDHGRALIIGEKTFGKGSIQSVLALRNGSGLRLTTAHYFTPSGNDIHNHGIQPDVLLMPGDVNENDPALHEALQQLKSMVAGNPQP